MIHRENRRISFVLLHIDPAIETVVGIRNPSPMVFFFAARLKVIHQVCHQYARELISILVDFVKEMKDSRISTMRRGRMNWTILHFSDFGDVEEESGGGLIVANSNGDSYIDQDFVVLDDRGNRGLFCRRVGLLELEAK